MEGVSSVSSVSLVDLLRNSGVDMETVDEAVIIELRCEQLRLYQSSFSSSGWGG